ncbi:MAG: lysylphosphatidylglycerol synthase transmembrane domain-containing protein [Candidatus Bathyarchaeia archaeon]
MTQPKYAITWKTLILIPIGLIAFLAYIYIFRVDIQDIVANVQGINLDFYALATVAAVLDTLFFTFAWYSLLKFLKVKVSLFKSFLFVWIGIFIDGLIPAESVSGEVAKIYLVNKEHDGTAGAATASVVAQRLIGMGLNVTTLLVGAFLLLVESLLYGIMLALILFLVAVIFVFLALILLLCVKQNWTFGLVGAVTGFVERVSRGRWKLSRLREELVEVARSFHSAMRDYAHAPKTLLTAFVFSTASWAFSLAVFFLTFLAIPNAKISWSAILVTSAIFVAVKSVPVGVPFEVGLPEIALSSLLMIFGVPREISFTATILIRLPTFWLRFFVGFGAQQWLGIKAFMTRTKGQTELPKN